MSPDRLICWPEVERRIPYTRQHVCRLEARGLFPRRVKVGANRIAWRESEIQEWIDALERGPLPLPRSRAQAALSLPPDLPDYSPDDGDRSIERTIAITRITEAIGLAVAIAVLLWAILAVLFATSPAAAATLLQAETLEPPFEKNPDHAPRGGEPGQQVRFDFGDVPGMGTTIACPMAECLVQITGHLAFQIANPSKDAVCDHPHRYLLVVALTHNGSRLPGTVGNSNVPRSEHYYDQPFAATFKVSQGAHTIRLQARAHPKDTTDCVPFIKERGYSRMDLVVWGVGE